MKQYTDAATLERRIQAPFAGSGKGHAPGLVPDPGAVPHLPPRVLWETGEWGELPVTDPPPTPSLTPTGVIPGSYRSTDLTVNEFGLILSATDGGTTGAALESIALVVPSEWSVTGSPVTGPSGTFTISKSVQTANTIYAGPTTGAPAAPTFRSLTTSDLPAAAIYNPVTDPLLILLG